METKQKFKGCFVATLTPFDSSGGLNEGQVAAHTRWLVENGVDGLCPAGTTGEFLFLSNTERRRLVVATVEAAAGKALVVAGVWAEDATSAAENARAAEAAGADGVFLQTPIYYPAGDDTLYAWYESVARSVRIPTFGYNIPQYAANTISLTCAERMMRDGVIAGIKDSSGSETRIADLVRIAGDSKSVFAASDSFATKGRELGADGFISAIGNVAPALFSRLWAGETDLQARVDAIRTTMKQVGSISGLKSLLRCQGFEFGDSRIPFSALTADQVAGLAGLDLS